MNRLGKNGPNHGARKDIHRKGQAGIRNGNDAGLARLWAAPKPSISSEASFFKANRSFFGV
jgi:hypothetical protein